MDCLLTQFRNLYLNCDCGMGYIVRCKDGRFILIDGGLGEADEADAFLERIKSLSEDEKPVIALWIITHAHCDHFGIFNRLVLDRGDELEVEKVAFRFPSREKASGFSNTDEFERALDVIGRERIITPSSGDGLDIPGCRVDFLFTEGDLPEGKVYQVNETSLAFMLTFGRRRALFIGDGCRTLSRILCEKYTSDELKCDIFQVGHHGYWGGSPELHAKTSPSILLWPTPDFRIPLILNHPDEMLERYLPSYMKPETLFDMWRTNGSLTDLPSVKVISYAGREEITLNMTRFDRSDDPWEVPDGFISRKIENRGDSDCEGFGESLYSLHWSFINGGFYSFGPVKLGFSDGNAEISTLTDRTAAGYLISHGRFGDHKSFRITLNGTLESGEMAVQYYGEPPVLLENLRPLEIMPEYGRAFELMIEADERTHKAVVSLDGRSEETDYDPDEMKGFFIFLKEAKLRISRLDLQLI